MIISQCLSFLYAGQRAWMLICMSCRSWIWYEYPIVLRPCRCAEVHLFLVVPLLDFNCDPIVILLWSYTWRRSSSLRWTFDVNVHIGCPSICGKGTTNSHGRLTVNISQQKWTFVDSFEDGGTSICAMRRNLYVLHYGDGRVQQQPGSWDPASPTFNVV